MIYKSIQAPTQIDSIKKLSFSLTIVIRGSVPKHVPVWSIVNTIWNEGNTVKVTKEIDRDNSAVSSPWASLDTLES